MFTTAMIRNILHNRAEYIKSIKKRKKKSYIVAAAELEAKMKQILEDNKGLLVEADFNVVNENQIEEHLQEDKSKQP